MDASLPAPRKDHARIVEHDLHARFAGRLPDETLSEIARDEVDALRSAKVRDFVPVLASRRARIRAQRLLS